MVDTAKTERAALAPPSSPPPTGWARRLRNHLDEPYFRNSYALVLNTVVTGLLGVAFWLLAARKYADPDVGRGSAAISAMTLLSGLVAVNMTGTLSRFIPQLGRRTSRMVWYAYAAGSVAVATLATGFLLTLRFWGPSFDLLRDPGVGFWFVAAVVAAGIFTMQDGVLVGLRSSVWVPAENGAFGVAKIVLLVLLAPGFPHGGVFFSWLVPLAGLLLPINLLIFGRLIPRHVRNTDAGVVPPSPAAVGRFLTADYFGALCVFGALYLVPVSVAASVLPSAFAYFYVAWTMAGILNLVAVNLAHSLTVEGVYAAHKLAAHCRAALVRAVGLLLVAAVVVALVAPYGLPVLGRGYRDAAPLLQILAFAALPQAIVDIWLGVLRAQNRVRRIAHVQIASGTLLVCLVVGWLRVAPSTTVEQLTGVGIAVLASQTLVALLVLPGLLRFIKTSMPAEPVPDTRKLPAPSGPAPSTGSPAVIGDPDRTGLAPARAGPGVFGLLPPRAVAVLPVTGVCLLTVASLLLYVLPLAEVDLGGLNGYGLISVLPVTSLVGLALLALTFLGTLSLPRPHPVVLGAQLVALVGCLHGMSALIEPLPRFPTAWMHLGFVDYIGRTGTAAPGLDARFSWPGFFAVVAFLAGGGSGPDLIPVLKYTPLVSNLLYLLPLWLLLSNFRASWQAKWFAAWLFCVLNWVGQDYFSPQGFCYLLYLFFLAILVTWLRGERPGRGRSLGMRTPGELPARRQTAHAVRVTALLLVIGLFTAATVSHQLTPFFMLAACAGLVLARRCAATGLPVLLSVILATWLSYLTLPYWSGHLHVLLGGIGDLLGNLSTSVVARAESGDGQHQLVVHARIALTAMLFALAALGLLRRRRRAIDDRVAVVLLIAPFLAVGMQSYGGEIMLRVYLFALPAACLLAAYAFFPDHTRSATRSPRRFLAAGVCGLVLVSGFVLARYGNERYEIVRGGELAAVQYVHQQPGPAQILYLTSDDAPPFIPVGYQDVARVSQIGMPAPRDPDDVRDVVDRLSALGGGSYLVTTRSQEAYLELAAGYPSTWGERLRARLAVTPQLQVVQQTPDAVVYLYRGPPQPAPMPPQPATGGAWIGSTPWTPVGVVFFVLSLAVLTGRELWRLRLDQDRCPAPDQRRRLRPLTLAALPLLTGLALVIAERLVLLAS